MNYRRTSFFGIKCRKGPRQLEADYFRHPQKMDQPHQIWDQSEIAKSVQKDQCVRSGMRSHYLRDQKTDQSEQWKKINWRTGKHQKTDQCLIMRFMLSKNVMRTQMQYGTFRCCSQARSRVGNEDYGRQAWLRRWYVNSSGSRFFFVGGFVALWWLYIGRLGWRAGMWSQAVPASSLLEAREAGLVDALVCEFKRFPLHLRWRLCGVVVAQVTASSWSSSLVTSSSLEALWRCGGSASYRWKLCGSGGGSASLVV